jgi:hypothetical protein
VLNNSGDLVHRTDFLGIGLLNIFQYIFDVLFEVDIDFLDYFVIFIGNLEKFADEFLVLLLEQEFHAAIGVINQVFENLRID